MVMAQETAIEYWLDYIDAGQMAALATVLASETTRRQWLQSKRLFISETEQVGKLGNRNLEKQVVDWATKKFSEKVPKPETRFFLLENGGEIRIFLDIYIPPIEIMIFGAGHDAIPVAAHSVSLGFPTTVVDARRHYNTEERFPNTRRVIAKDTELSKVSISKRTYIIVMNHHIEKDEQTLAYVLKSASPYVGVLGPRSRRIKLLKRLEEDGTTFTKQALTKMHSPVGLNIGASTPAEIAISILAEIIALKNGHTAGFLKGSNIIHK